MNMPTMNEMQLCGAGSTVPEARVESPAVPPRHPKSGARQAAAFVLGAALLAIVAAAWLVASRATSPHVVDLPRVVIHAERPAPGSCPVPVETLGADCPVPTQAVSTDAAAD